MGLDLLFFIWKGFTMMKNSSTLTLNKQIFDKCNECIVITGCARSGTTILSKIIHSFSNVELSFEPPMLFSLFPLINKLSQNDWKLLYETYLY